MAAVTRLALYGGARPPYGSFAGKLVVVATLTVPGLEYTMPDNKLHFTMDDNRLHYTMKDEDG